MHLTADWKVVGLILHCGIIFFFPGWTDIWIYPASRNGQLGSPTECKDGGRALALTFHKVTAEKCEDIYTTHPYST